jgi:hypothetical protein
VAKKSTLHSTIQRVQNFESDLHFVPQDDWFEHLQDANCPCNPKLDAENLRETKSGLAHAQIWVHTCVKAARSELS